jgi:hypothetical protein
MTVARKTEFTSGREIGFRGPWSFYADAGPYSENSHKRGLAARTREHDRDSSAGPFVRLNMERFERVGRRFVRQVTLDGLAQWLGAERGSALRIKPDEELRRKIRLYKEIQGAREAAYAALHLSLGESAEDAPARLGLGGLQDFTPGREITHKRPKGYAPWRPHKKTTRLMFQVKQILEEYRDHLPLTGRQIFYRMVAAYSYPKTENAANNLGEHLTRARRAEMIPFEHIRDDGISTMAQAHYADENAFYKHIHGRG